MDRWSQRETETGVGLDAAPKAPATRVTRLGLGGFVKSDGGMASETDDHLAAKIEVVASRRERRAQEAAAAMPPPMPVARAGPQPSASGYSPPAWAGTPPQGFSLEVLKGGTAVDEVLLSRAAMLFGRGATCDQVLDHPSISRQHAAVCYQAASQRWFVVDLGSVHRTFVDGRPVDKSAPAELKPGSTLRFAASTREYVLHGPERKRSLPAGKHISDSEIKGPDQKRVRFAGGGGDASELEQVIGYSDGGSFAANVGPLRDPHDEGRFANLVKTRRVSDANPAMDSQPLAEGVESDANGKAVRTERRALPSTPAAGTGQRRVPAAATQPFQGAKLYDWLPPARPAAPT